MSTLFATIAIILLFLFRRDLISIRSFALLSVGFFYSRLLIRDFPQAMDISKLFMQQRAKTMSDIIKKGPWRRVYLCEDCATVLSENEVYFSDDTCRHCGATGTFTAPAVKTSRRYVYTQLPQRLTLFNFWKDRGEEKGYWEYSNKTADGEAMPRPLRAKLSKTSRIVNIGVAASIL